MEQMSYEVSLVPTDHVQLVLPEVMPLMRMLEERMSDRYSVDDLVNFLLDGTLDLWVVLHGGEIVAFVASRIFDYPQARCLSLQFAAGREMEAISRPLMQTFHRYARDTGCTEIEALGRAGWARHLEPYGFRTAYTVVKKEI